MKTYRIVKNIFVDSVWYEVQRKSIFGFWYNPDNVDGRSTGCWDTLKEAKLSIRQKVEPIERIIINKPAKS